MFLTVVAEAAEEKKDSDQHIFPDTYTQLAPTIMTSIDRFLFITLNISAWNYGLLQDKKIEMYADLLAVQLQDMIKNQEKDASLEKYN